MVTGIPPDPLNAIFSRETAHPIIVIERMLERSAFVLLSFPVNARRLSNAVAGKKPTCSAHIHTPFLCKYVQFICGV